MRAGVTFRNRRVVRARALLLRRRGEEKLCLRKIVQPL
jgi:hypothetical protein